MFEINADGLLEYGRGFQNSNAKTLEYWSLNYWKALKSAVKNSFSFKCCFTKIIKFLAVFLLGALI